MAAGAVADLRVPLSDQKSKAPATMSAWRRASAHAASHPAQTTSSASQKAMRSPRAARTPTFRAAGARRGRGVDDPEALVVLGPTAGHVAAAVAGAVVGHDDLPRLRAFLVGEGP